MRALIAQSRAMTNSWSDTVSQANSHEPAPRLLRLPATLERVSLGRTAWLDLVREGNAPKPVKLGKASAWVESEISDWLRERIRTGRRA